MAAIIDTDKIQQLLGHNEALFEQMLRLFAHDLQEHRDQLQALATDDWPQYQQLLHRLIGSASYFGADSLRALLVQAALLNRQQDGQQLAVLLAQIYQEISRILTCEPVQQALAKADNSA